jgi:hypothetical protein
MIRLSLMRSSAVATVAAMALAACASRSGMTPSSPTAAAGAQNMPGIAPAPPTCATSPPQYGWIFKGACDEFMLKPSGTHFKLFGYQGISVKGFIGNNRLKRPATIAFADAIDANGDIESYKGQSFPQYVGEGTTYVYLTTINQSTRTIKFAPVKGKPEFEYVITNAEGFGSYTQCGWALLTFPPGKPPRWLELPNTGIVEGKTVRLGQYVIPIGFGIHPKSPLYLAVNCFS